MGLFVPLSIAWDHDDKWHCHMKIMQHQQAHHKPLKIDFESFIIHKKSQRIPQFWKVLIDKNLILFFTQCFSIGS